MLVPSRAHAGPLVARLYLRLLAVVSLVAWLSIGSQLRLLIGAHGLLPIAPLLDEARRQHLSFFELPTLFWISASDATLLGAAALGAAASLYGVLRPGRIWLALSLPLYLSVCVAARDFCGFQWDNLLLEASFLALFLDMRAPSRAALWLAPLLLVKLYVESGISKLGSPAGDWSSGTAMTAYFETAPLPAPLAPLFHALPAWFLHASAYVVLIVEILVPLFVFGPRALRRTAFVVLTTFQLVNVLTANYGFFVPLTLVLHVWLLDDELLLRFGAAPPEPRSATRLSRRVATGVLVGWSVLSVVEAQLNLGKEPEEGTLLARIADAALRVREVYAPLRIVGTYHLFASVTTERIEPLIVVRTDDNPAHVTELVLRYKPGPVERALPFVTPHQPRVDFQLWFHGLHPGGRLPAYLARLEQLLCDDPASVAQLFVTPPPEHARAVQLRYAIYHFTKNGDAAVWRRELRFERPERVCGEEEQQASNKRYKSSRRYR